MKVYVLIGIWQGLVEDLVVYTNKERAHIAASNLRRKYGKMGVALLEEKEVIENGM